MAGSYGIKVLFRIHIDYFYLLSSMLFEVSLFASFTFKYSGNCIPATIATIINL